MIVYLDSSNFSTATTVYLDSLLTLVAPDGYYSSNGYYRQQVDGKLIDLLPCVGIDTVSITSVGETTATFNGDLISDGGDANAIRGFVYGTSPSPTTANNVITDLVRGAGTYSLNVTGLDSVVQYYVRSYAVVFGDTIYGDQLNFTTVVIVPCNGTGSSTGGSIIEDRNVSLNSTGGVIVFLFDANIVVDKLEIYHGLPQNGGVNKKATTSMTASNNYGPFDNTYGTPASNTIPSNVQATDLDQFIGTDKGAVPTRQTEFTADTSLVISDMQAREQVVWWKYTAADYLVNSIATIRVTGNGASTVWNYIRVCP